MNIDFGPIGFFGPLAAIIIVARYLRYKERTQLYEAMRSALERGQSVPPEFIAELQSRRGRRYDAMASSFSQEPLAEQIAEVRYGPQRDLRRGIMWLAVGLGLVCVGVAFYAGLYNAGGAEEMFGVFSALGAIPACVGLAFLGLWYFNRGVTRL